MNPTAGWYQDPGAGPREARRGWIRRHKVASTVLALLLVGAVGNALDGEDEVSAAADSSHSADPGSSGSGSSADHANDDDGGADGQGQVPAKTPKPKPKPTKKSAPTPRFLVAEVVDGDTIRLGNGESVRLVGIDTPEDGQCGSLRATENLTSLILGERVRLTISDEDRDQYGRLLRYVVLGPIDAGLRQIKDGYAIARYDSRDGYGYHPREPLYIKADQASKNFSCPAPQQFAGGGNDCAPGYSPCIPPYPPDLDCADANGPIAVTGSDPHGLDADGDGIACEWG
jgi:endonuclease YncB( thermonuclease family)